MINNLYKKKQNQKIFCIGYSKTGTSSIAKALDILGYRTVHWLRAGYEPKEGWIQYIKKSKFEAFADYPIQKRVLLKVLDEEFPNSKFILTIRDQKSFVKSWRYYFRGTEFTIESIDDENELILKYNAHNKRILDYFKDKKSKFLIMDIFKGDGWNELCNFLDRPIPSKPFPHKRKRKYKK